MGDHASGQAARKHFSEKTSFESFMGLSWEWIVGVLVGILATLTATLSKIAMKKAPCSSITNPTDTIIKPVNSQSFHHQRSHHHLRILHI